MNDQNVSQLFAAVSNGDFEVLNNLLTLRPEIDINAKNSHGNNALIEAVVCKNNTAIEKLLTLRPDIDVNDRNDYCRTALIEAIRCQNNTAIEKLLTLRPDIDVNAKIFFGDNALIEAVVCKNNTAIEKLLTLRPEIDINAKNHSGKNALIEAVVCQNNTAIEKLLTLRPDIDVNAKNFTGATALMIAVVYNTAERLITLRPDIDINAKNNFGNTSLYYALRDGNVQAVNLLIEHGANANDLNQTLPMRASDSTLLLINAAKYCDMVIEAAQNYEIARANEDQEAAVIASEIKDRVLAESVNNLKNLLINQNPTEANLNINNFAKILINRAASNLFLKSEDNDFEKIMKINFKALKEFVHAIKKNKLIDTNNVDELDIDSMPTKVIDSIKGKKAVFKAIEDKCLYSEEYFTLKQLSKQNSFAVEPNEMFLGSEDEGKVVLQTGVLSHVLSFLRPKFNVVESHIYRHPDSIVKAYSKIKLGYKEFVCSKIESQLEQESMSWFPKFAKIKGLEALYDSLLNIKEYYQEEENYYNNFLQNFDLAEPDLVDSIEVAGYTNSSDNL